VKGGSRNKSGSLHDARFKTVMTKAGMNTSFTKKMSAGKGGKKKMAYEFGVNMMGNPKVTRNQISQFVSYDKRFMPD
jgi:hypothetical protein